MSTSVRKAPNVIAGDFVAVKARLLPPSHAALPGGYDFARDASFAGVGAVGSTLIASMVSDARFALFNIKRDIPARPPGLSERG